MEIVFLVILAAAILHFVYEGIVAPSLRLNIRFKLFELRDRLRRARSVDPGLVNKEVFDLLHNRLNNAIRMLPIIQISTLVEAKIRIDGSAEIRRNIQRSIELIENCASAEVKKIDAQVTEAFMMALAINTAGTIIYVVPVILSFVCLGSIAKTIKEILLVPAKDIERALRMQPPDLAMA